MSQGALLQLLLEGEEDIYLHSQEFLANKPFRQVFKKVTPFSVATLDMDVGLPTPVTYGQTLRFSIPRKGDLLTTLTVRIRAKKTSQMGYYPAEELIESASLVMGKQVIEELTGEYIRIHNAVMDDQDRRDARYRMSDFEVADEQGTEKWLYCNIPFFFSHRGCCLPLITLQYMQPEIVITFKSSVTSFDSTYQPQIRITGEYVFLDDTEREWWTRQEHDLLFPYIQMVEDRVDIEQSKISRQYSPEAAQFGQPLSVKGAAETVYDSDSKEVITSGANNEISYVEVVDTTTHPGNSMILYNAGTNAAEYRIKASLLLPKENSDNNPSSTSIVWARKINADGTTQPGYECEFFNPSGTSDINIRVYREGQRIVELTSSNVFTSVMTKVRDDDSSYDIRSNSFLDEVGDINVMGPGYDVWIDVDLVHSVDDLSRMTCSYTLWIYEASNNPAISYTKFAREDPFLGLLAKTKYFEVTEGYSAIPTIGIPTAMGFAATSEFFNVIVADISTSTTITPIEIATRQLTVTPVDENLTTKKTKIYNRGPVKYMMWTLTPPDPTTQWGQFSTGERGTYVTRHDPLDSAQLLINGKARTDMEEASFFSVYHPLNTIGKSLPTGVHMYSFARDPMGVEPDASMNFSRAGDITLYQRYKRWNPTATTLSELRPSESLPAARDYTRLRIYLIGYNVLLVKDGQMALRCV
jgi:hypothetical protein